MNNAVNEPVVVDDEFKQDPTLSENKISVEYQEKSNAHQLVFINLIS
jgi:hypothetical protein